MGWFKRLLGLEPKPRGLVMMVEIETLAPKPPRPPQPPRPPAQPRADLPRPVAAAFPPPDGEYRFLALDVETANEDVATICQIGIATVSQSGEVRGYSTLVNPRCRFVFSYLHGIDAHMVRDAPGFGEVFPAVLPLLSRHAIFQHSGFDRRAINAAHAALGLAAPNLRWHDSVRVARSAWPEFRGAGGHGLAHLKQALRLDFQHHDAGEDARAAAQVVLLAEQRLGQPFDLIVNARTPPTAVARAAFSPPISLDGAADGPLAGGIAVFTGELSMPREEAAARAAAVGLSVRTSVSRKTSLVVVGGPGPACDTPTGKHRQAMELAAGGAPIRIIGEAEFLALLAGAALPPAAPVAAPAQPAPKPAARPRAEAAQSGEVVVIAGAIAFDRLEAAARAEAAGMTVMTNVTRRTTLVVVTEADLGAPVEARSTRHRSAEAALAKGQALRIIGEAEFLALIGAG